MCVSVIVAIQRASRFSIGNIRKLGTEEPLIRNFHLYTLLYKSEDSRCGNYNKSSDEVIDKSETSQGKGNDHEEAGSKPNHHPISRRIRNGAVPMAKKSHSNSTHGLPPIILPNWFLQNNVRFEEDCEPIRLTGLCHKEPPTSDKSNEIHDSSVHGNLVENSSLNSVKYSLNYYIYTEILATLKAGLSLRPPKNNTSQAVLRPVTVLQCHKDGASIYLDHIVLKLCSDLSADLVQLDAQDIAQIIGPYLDGNLAWNATTTSLYGYNAQRVSNKLEHYEDYKNGNDQESEQSNQGIDENIPTSILGNLGFSSSYTGDDFSKLLSIVIQKPRDNSRSTLWPHDENNYSNRTFDSVSRDRSKENCSHVPWNNLKTSAILKAIVEAADFKRVSENKKMSEIISEFREEKTESIITKKFDESCSEIKTRPLVIQIKDYQEIRSLDGGIELLQRLHKIVDKKWLDGQKIICVGTTEGVETVYEKRAIQILQEDVILADKRTILVSPDFEKSQDIQFKIDKKKRIRKINIRHLEDMILKLVEGNNILPVIEIEQNLDSATILTSRLEENVWTFARIHRIAITLLGLSHLDTSLINPVRYDGVSLTRALTVLSNSDEAKFAWGAEEIKESNTLASKSTDVRKIPKVIYNSYEKKLLSGIISPEKIKTTFDDIIVPEELIQALKSSTSLSLTRPEAFTYGILHSDRIPGILLYGPPGTGKTLLAEAVAKESGATVLEVTAADLNNMYVGEGEKNVKALFTLAKKLAPCVIFIDEADSMFGNREGSRQRAGHREMINQFLREWDGINDFSGFIMVATNRPYDLDDAILRRIPRRLLIDLPTEKDREEILKIHLKDEHLHANVSLSALARDTPYYSGSDLKNLCVAAALACVREENEVANQHSCDSIYEYPKTRLLAKRHFDKAIEEISASINEDMSSLQAIKKFDEKYGNRKGRKKSPGLGFGPSRVTKEFNSESVRVRPLLDV